MAVEPYDEQEIHGADTIIRRVPDQQIVWDDNRGRHRVSSGLFEKSSDPRGGMSVDIEALMLKDAIDPTEYVTTPVFRGAVSMSAESIRALDLMIGYEPIADEPGIDDNPYHGEVWRKEEARKFTGAQRKGLRDAAEWYVELVDVDLK